MTKIFCYPADIPAGYGAWGSADHTHLIAVARKTSWQFPKQIVFHLSVFQGVFKIWVLIFIALGYSVSNIGSQMNIFSFGFILEEGFTEPYNWSQHVELVIETQLKVKDAYILS